MSSATFTPSIKLRNLSKLSRLSSSFWNQWRWNWRKKNVCRVYSQNHSELKAEPPTPDSKGLRVLPQWTWVYILRHIFKTKELPRNLSFLKDLPLFSCKFPALSLWIWMMSVFSVLKDIPLIWIIWLNFSVLFFAWTNIPQPNYIGTATIPSECFIQVPWFQNPYPITTWNWDSVEEFKPWVLSWTPTPDELFPSGVWVIFALFFLKQDIYYPWLCDLDFHVAKNTSRFRTAWLRGEMGLERYEGCCLCTFLFVQKKFTEFIQQILNHVINPAARKIAILNGEVVASIIMLGLDKFENWYLSNDFWAYFTDAHAGLALPNATHLPFTLHPRHLWTFYSFTMLHFFWSFQTPCLQLRNLLWFTSLLYQYCK